MRYLIGLLFLMLLGLTACSGGHHEKAKKGDHGKGTVWAGQTKAIDKAQHVNKVIQKSAARQRKAIEKDSK